MPFPAVGKLLPEIAASLERGRSVALGRRPASSHRYAIQRTVYACGEPMVACWGPAHTVLAVNASAQRLVPRVHGTPDLPFADLWPTLRAAFVPLFAAALRGRPCVLGQTAAWVDEPAPGHPEYLLSAVYPIPDVDGTPVGILWSFTTVTASVLAADFLDAVLTVPDLRFTLVSLPGCVIEWASTDDPSVAPALGTLPARDYFDPAVCAALPTATEGAPVRAVTVGDTTYVLYAVTRTGAAPGVLVVASPAPLAVGPGTTPPIE